MSASDSWRDVLAGKAGGEILVDLGTTTVTGVCASGAPELAARNPFVGHPVLGTLPLHAADTADLGSHFARTGLLFEPPVLVDDVFTDSYGVDWLVAEGSAAPLNHPLEDADYLEVARHPRPSWPRLWQSPGLGVDLLDDEYDGYDHDLGYDDVDVLPSEQPLVVADAPTSGLLETCFALRNSWQFLIDVTESWRVANALLDWAAESVASGYEQMLAGLPVQPDVVLYGDDYGYQSGMFLSDQDFRTFVRPRLRMILSRIRRSTSAAICFHCCGAVRPILGDLADLGVDMLNLQNDARGMGLEDVRRTVPRDLVLHGFTDLRMLGEALETGSRRSVAILTEELVASAPCIAAPVDNLATATDLALAARGARFVRALSAEDIAQVSRLGAVASVIDHASAVSRTPDHLPLGRAPIAVTASGASARFTRDPAPSPARPS